MSSPPSSPLALPKLHPNAQFTEEELQAAEKVFDRLTDEVFAHPSFRLLRKRMEPFVQLQIKKRFGDVPPEFATAKAAAERRLKQRRMQSLVSLDHDMINKRRLRAERLKQLSAMVHESDDVDTLPMIPDGAVFDGVNMSAGQTSGTSSVISVQNRAGVVDKLIEAPSVPPTVDTTTTDDPNTLFRPRSCYVCKCRFLILHHFYDSLCPTCAEFNFAKRMYSADLTGKVALLTGGRVKVGYQILLKLLRAGATVVVTSRFPVDTMERLSHEADFVTFRSRVKVFGIDLRDLVAVEEFCDILNKTLPRLDIIINNACQTVRRPPAYYKHLLANEKTMGQGRFEDVIMQGTLHQGFSPRPLLLVGNSQVNLEALPSSSSLTPEAPTPTLLSSELTQVPLLMEDHNPDKSLFPEGVFDVNAQQIDWRAKTSWSLKLEDVSTPEAIEVMAVNALAPFIICGRLKNLMIRSRELDVKEGRPDVGRYIVNVSSMEGKFYRKKDACHPHSNMAKASLNMMTRTSAQDYVNDGIYMTAVDTGWLSIEAPVPKAIRIVQTNFQTPIDEVDGASRVLDPVWDGMLTQDASKRVWGCLLKDYRLTEF